MHTRERTKIVTQQEKLKTRQHFFLEFFYKKDLDELYLIV